MCVKEFLARQIASGGVTNPLAAVPLSAPDEVTPREALLQSPIRQLARYISSHVLFEALIIIVIMLSSISLAVEGPPNAAYLNPYPEVRILLEVSDVTFFLIFWVEFVLKVVGHGFSFQPASGTDPGGYLGDGW